MSFRRKPLRLSLILYGICEWETGQIFHPFPESRGQGNYYSVPRMIVLWGGSSGHENVQTLAPSFWAPCLRVQGLFHPVSDKGCSWACAQIKHELQKGASLFGHHLRHIVKLGPSTTRLKKHRTANPVPAFRSAHYWQDTRFSGYQEIGLVLSPKVQAMNHLTLWGSSGHLIYRRISVEAASLKSALLTNSTKT